MTGYHDLNANNYPSFTSVGDNNNLSRDDNPESDISRKNREETKPEKNNIDVNINIYRFKFTQEIMDALYEFSKVHRYDGRKIFKECWSIWADENEEFLDIEVKRLHKLGYEGDVMDKMFKSARYYFRKKSTSKKDPKKRRQYVCVRREILDAMDDHIWLGLRNGDFKPAEGFVEFCNISKDLLKNELMHMINNGLTDSKVVQSKVKKTYKNRYFMISKNEY